jgi:hypothetical protein
MYDRAAGNHHLQIIARPACLVSARTALPGFSPELPRYPEIRQRIHRWLGNQVHTTAVTSIATVRPTPFDELLAPETQAAVTTVTGLYADGCFVDEFHCFSLKKTPLSAGLLFS